MREGLMRLRSALTPHAVLLLGASMLLLAFAMAQKSSGSAPAQTQLEERAGAVLSAMAGAGKVEVVINMGEAADGAGRRLPDAVLAPSGAVAVAQGADDPLVKLELQEALCALLGLPACAVSVVAGGR